MARATNEPLRKVMTRCASCDHCRDLMADTSCTFFTELYRLVDREKAAGIAATPEEMRRLAALCNFCGICPCPPIRAWIRDAKAVMVEQEGLPLPIRILEDVARVGRLGGMAPKVVNFIARSEYLSRAVKGVAGIHPERKLPEFPQEGFDAWAKARGIDRMSRAPERKVAYFVGCSARYLFPGVAKATVQLLQHNGIDVYVPPQKCCGTPSIMEGDKRFTLEAMSFNVRELSACVEAGYDIVCSCPSCGYLLKGILREGAEYSPAFHQRMEQLTREEKGEIGQVMARLVEERLVASTGRAATANLRQWQLTFAGGSLFRDEGYFADMNGVDRLRIANHTFDLGEYLLTLERAGELKRPVRPLDSRLAYFAPCHQREQNIGTPWVTLLGLLSGKVESVGDPFDCCGQAGIHGYKKAVHAASVATASRLMEKIDRARPEQLVTDCLSCGVQFNQLRDYRITHPVELLWDAMGVSEAPVP